MIRVNVVVEGQTEEGFVKKVLYPYMFERNVIMTPRLVLLKRSKTSIARGGLHNYENPKWDILQWIKEERLAYCTTMFDFYGLPVDFPGMNDMPLGSTPEDQVIHLEEALSADLRNQRRFLPYLQLHEFEALLFSDINKLNEALSTLESVTKYHDLHQIIKRFKNPELINGNPSTSPSKRLLSLYPAYDKRFYGELVAEMIGIDRIRVKCPHFNSWINRLEQLS